MRYLLSKQARRHPGLGFTGFGGAVAALNR